MRTALAALAAVLLAPAAAGADPLIDIAVQPEAVAFPGPDTLTYTITARAPAQPERFRMSVRQQPLPDGTVPAGDPEVDGDPAFALSSIANALLAACSPDQSPNAGYSDFLATYAVTLDAGASAQMRLTYRTGAFVPWPGASLRLRVEADNTPVAAGGRRGTLSRDLALMSPRPRMTLARRGVHLDFTTSPFTGRPSLRTARLALGRAIAVRGTTAPMLHGQGIELRVRREREPSVTAMTARTDAGGRFRFRYVPQARGFHQLWVRYRSQRRSLVSGEACARALRVTR